MRVTLLCLVVLLVVPYADAVSAPEADGAAKEKLEALKKRLPGILTDWVKEKNNVTWLPGGPRNTFSCKPEWRVFRRVGPERAKAVILFAAYMEDGGRRHEGFDVLSTVYLAYQDGCWTTETFDVVARRDEDVLKRLRQTFAFLMLAIDEAAEKP